MRDRSVLQSSAQKALAECTKPRGYTVFVGGFPCQDLSVANANGKGLGGDRSGLWKEYKRIIAGTSPDWIVTENVGHTWRRWVPQLRRELHELGYASLPLRVRASDLGAPHERSRIFLVAHANSQFLRELSRWWKGPGRKMAQEFTEFRDLTPRRLGKDDGLPGWMDRRKALGNAIIPQIAEIIATGISEAMK